MSIFYAGQVTIPAQRAPAVQLPCLRRHPSYRHHPHNRLRCRPSTISTAFITAASKPALISASIITIITTASVTPPSPPPPSPLVAAGGGLCWLLGLARLLIERRHGGGGGQHGREIGAAKGVSSNRQQKAAHGPANTRLFDATLFCELFQVGDGHAIIVIA